MPEEAVHASKRQRRGEEDLQRPAASSEQRATTLDPLKEVNSSPAVPQRFNGSISEAASVMLDRPENTGGTRSMKLARPSMNRPRRGSGRSLSRRSSDQNVSFTQTALEAKRIEGVNILDTVGITEVLDQDERPTFIIDIGNASNFQPGELDIIFLNASLKARPGLVDCICGRVEDVPLALATPASFPEFKTWVLSFVKNGQALGVALPAFTYAGMLWTCSTLRKRFRLIAGRPANPTSGSTFVTQQYIGLGSISPGSQASSHSTAGYFDSAESGATGERYKFEHKSSSSSSGKRSALTTRTHDSESWRRTPKLAEAGSSMTHEDSEAILIAATAGDVDPFIPTTIPDQGFFDWTRLPMSAALPRHTQFARSVDWGATSLGPMNTWNVDLRAMCNLIMASPHPAAMYWGEDLIAIYNEAYILLAGQKHPNLMGQPYKEAWKEIWVAVEDVFANARHNAQATMKDDDRLFIDRQGFLEETYFSWSIIPLIGEDGSVVGLYNPAFEKTRRKIAERRMLTLREIGEKTASAREVSQFWPLLLKGLEYNEHDIPLALVYSVADDSHDSDASSMHSSSLLTSKTCILQGTLGIPVGHPAAPQEIELGHSMDGFAPAFRDAVKADRPILLQQEDGTLPEGFLDEVERRGFGDPCRSVVVCPIHPTSEESTLGFLVIGNNPRRPYDEDYSLFVQLLGRQLATSIASVVLYEEEIRRAEKAAKLAAQDRIELSNQLAMRTQEAVESEHKFTRMAELAPVGMFIADSTGKMAYCNDMWFQISRCSREGKGEEDWMDYVQEADRPSLDKSWQKLINNRIPMSSEFRFKHPWRDRNGNSGDTWVLASAYPERGADGQLKRIFGSITDISSQKFAEGLQKRRMEEAVELKRQQENFIDITSHEMRNPLSAILQCADEISSSLSASQSLENLAPHVKELLESNSDSAQTIILCAQHQKRIVDDVLTLSKLDSAMLLVTPVDVQPIAVMQRALKMFENELRTADIALRFRVDKSMEDLKIDWVRLDPSRLLQVLINLTTNAIKFTTQQERRIITVSVAAYQQRPSLLDDKPVEYVTPNRVRFRDPDEGPEWGNGEPVYLHFAVEDTGRGLADSEKKLMFLRFSQASPRTHVQYGGSGLGLFISRQLVELQGGEIGVSSVSGEGSIFAFYVKARRSSAPADILVPPGNVPTRRGSGSKPLTRVPSSAHDSTQHIATAVAKLTREMPTRIPSSENTNDSSASKATSSEQPLNILIVEDNLVNQKVLAKQLQKVGCVVSVANHGGEAIEFMKKTVYYTRDPEALKKGLKLSVVLMDLEMPVMDGISCAKEIRRMQEAGDLRSHVPVIAVTANAREKQIEMALSSGMDDVVSKPFRIAELIPKMKNLAKQIGLESEGAK